MWYVLVYILAKTIYKPHLKKSGFKKYQRKLWSLRALFQVPWLSTIYISDNKYYVMTLQVVLNVKLRLS